MRHGSFIARRSRLHFRSVCEKMPRVAFEGRMLVIGLGAVSRCTLPLLLPPSTEWIGPMAFTPDQLPAIGVLRPGMIVAAAFNGYGGSYTTAAGEAAALLAVDGVPPPWLDADVFAPARLVRSERLDD